MLQPRHLLLAVLACAWPTTARAQFPVEEWNKPAEPFRVIGPIHFVGTIELAAFLITTSAGAILIDGGLPESAPLIERSIRKLGSKPEDIRFLLTTQAHFDHVGSLAHLARLSGGRVEVMEGDVDVVESGGRADYLFGDTCPKCRFPPVNVDRTLHDGDTVSLGGLRLTARRTPGHTRGSTTWLTSVEDGGRSYDVVFTASTSINPGTRLVDRPSYPGIADDLASTFRLLESLKPDVFLAAHTGFFALEQKRARLGSSGDRHPFVDPESFRTHVAAKKAAFETQLARERATRAPAAPAR